MLCYVCMYGVLLDECVGVSGQLVHVFLDESVRRVNHRTREVKNAKFVILKSVCMYVCMLSIYISYCMYVCMYCIWVILRVYVCM